MSALGLPMFDKAIQDANIWLNEIMYELDWEDKHRAYILLRSVLHVLRDRLQHNEASQLAAQLPTMIRGIYYDGYRAAKPATDIRHRDQFVAEVEKAFANDPNDSPDEAVTAALNILADHVSKGEIDDVKATLPKELRDLWD